jgi:hypothetical protein
MKWLLLLVVSFLFSCSPGTDPPGGDLYEGEPLINCGLGIFSNKKSIGYSDSFSVFTQFCAQNYRIKGELRLYGNGFHDSLLVLSSPSAVLVEKVNGDSLIADMYKINIELLPNQVVSFEWKFKSDSMSDYIKHFKTGNSLWFSSEFRLSSILLDMDTLYTGPGRPIAVPEKRWYHIFRDSLGDRLNLSKLFFSSQYITRSGEYCINYKY